MLSTVPARQVDAANEEGGRQRIRACRIRGHDAGGDDAIRRPAGPGIDDVTVATTVGDDELLSGAARAERGVQQPEPGDRVPGHHRRHEVDPPTVAATANGEQATAARREQGVLDARPSEADARTIKGVALADRTEVQLDARLAEPDGAVIARDVHGAEPHHRARGLNRLRVGEARLPPQEPPAPAERHRRDVKSAARLLVKPLAGREQVGQVPRDDDGLAGRVAIDL